MPKSIGAVLGDIYDAWRVHDLDWFASYLPADFRHIINVPLGVTPLGGVRHGKQASLDRLNAIWREFDTQRLTASHIALSDNRATVEVQARCLHRQTGAIIETVKTNVWTLEDGWPVTLHEYYDVDLIRAFFETLAPKRAS